MRLGRFLPRLRSKAVSLNLSSFFRSSIHWYLPALSPFCFISTALRVIFDPFYNAKPLFTIRGPLKALFWGNKKKDQLWVSRSRCWRTMAITSPTTLTSLTSPVTSYRPSNITRITSPTATSLAILYHSIHSKSLRVCIHNLLESNILKQHCTKRH